MFLQSLIGTVSGRDRSTSNMVWIKHKSHPHLRCTFLTQSSHSDTWPPREQRRMVSGSLNRSKRSREEQCVSTGRDDGKNRSEVTDKNGDVQLFTGTEDVWWDSLLKKRKGTV